MNARSVAALLLPMTAAACGHTDEAPPRECRDVVVDFGGVMNEASAQPGACATDFDCTLQRPSLNCTTGARVETCPLALSSDVYNGLIDRTSSLEDELCAQHCAIAVFVDCKSVHAACDMATKTCATIID